MIHPETDDEFALRLQAIFGAEARLHLAQADASLAALAGAGAAQQAAPVALLRQTLHTLKGAARSVGLHELEYLCHALDGVLAAADRGLAPADVAIMQPAVAIAGQLLAPAGARARNQAMLLAAQLEALARRLAAPAPCPVPAAP